jgi:DNA repair photolyase
VFPSQAAANAAFQADPNYYYEKMAEWSQTRGGKDYVSQWGERQRGAGPVADLIARRFAAARARYGLEAPRLKLDIEQFRPPPKPGDQMELLLE